MSLRRRDLLMLPPALALAHASAVLGSPVEPETAAETTARPSEQLRFLLNSGPSGANAWFFVAEDSGFFRDEGLEISFTDGRGAWTAAPRQFAEGFDLAYGDINSLVEVAAANPGKAPIGVYMMFNRTPAVIGVDARGPIMAPRDLPGRRLEGHASDVALCLWPAYAAATGVDPAAITPRTVDVPPAKMVAAMLAGKSDGCFGYFTTLGAAARTNNLDPDKVLRFLRFDTALPDFYGSAVMASEALVSERPGVVGRAVAAINRGVIATIADPEAAITAVLKRAPKARRDVELARLQGTLAREMAHPEGKTLGTGDADDARLGRSIAVLARTKGLPTTPPLRSVFRRDFLPSLEERPVRL
jgi:NitT/TauT family transport system substrate-binding protein